MQKERTLRMNGHGRRYQATVGLMLIEGLVNPDGIITIDKEKLTVKKLFLKAMHDDKLMFLSNTEKWQSTAWYAVYIKKYDKACM